VRHKERGTSSPRIGSREGGAETPSEGLGAAAISSEGKSGKGIGGAHCSSFTDEIAQLQAVYQKKGRYEEQFLNRGARKPKLSLFRECSTKRSLLRERLESLFSRRALKTGGRTERRLCSGSERSTPFAPLKEDFRGLGHRGGESR